MNLVTITSFALFIGSAQSLFWTNNSVECQTFDSDTKACGVISLRTCAIGSCSGGADIPFTAGSDTPSAALASSSDQPAVSDVPSPSLSDSPTVGIGAIRRSVQYSFVPHYLEGRSYDTFFGDPDPVNIVKVSLSFAYECEITIDGDTCSSCTYCGEYKYTADCTNIPNGRQTFCESAEVDDFRNQLVSLFFPLTSTSPAALASGPGPTAAPTTSVESASSTPSSAPSAAPYMSSSSTPSVDPTAAPSTSPSTQPPSVDLQKDCVQCTDTPPHWFPDNYSCGGSDWRRYVRNNCWRNKWRQNDWCTYSCATKWNKIQMQCCSPTLSTPTGSPTADTPTITSTNTPTAAPVISNTVSPMQPSVSSPSPSVAPSIYPSSAPSVVPAAAPSASPSTQLPSGDLQENCVLCTDTPPHWFPANYSCAGSDWRGYVRNNCWRNKWRGNDWCTFSCATKWNKIEVNCCDPTSGRRHLRETKPALSR